MEAGKFYDQFTIEDFILDERFHEWVMHGRDDEFWQAQLRNCPEKSDMIHAARDFILNLKIREHLPGSAREQAAVQRFRELTRQDGKAATAPAGAGLKWLRGVAASLLVLCLLGGGTWMLFKKKPVLVKTEYGQMKQVKLPDNSIIYLNANSNIRYEKSLLGGFSREVWLEGEAFFEVEKQKNGSGGYRNFLVHTQGMAVEVLGTSFNVRDRHAVSSVTLQSGKVEVNMNEGRKVMLEPGERIEISRKAKSVIKNKVKPERYTSWKNLRYTFDQTPVSELVQIINDNYGLQVLITDNKIAGSKLSGVLEANNLQTFVNALSFALNITIRKKGNQLIFEPKQE